ncbi:MAG: hydroxyacid dehydrogenase, partial [Clostridia bacterium]|nr:hydroxyacid dehydrogenase [Clostridia bacterium]
GAENLGGAKRLKLICITATGFDNVDVAYCRSVGIGVVNVVGYSTDSVAQITLSLGLSLYSRLREYDAFVRTGAYSAGTAHNRLIPVYHELAGKTWGVVGYGNIGRKVAAVAKALGCRVVCTRKNATGEEPDGVLPIDELLRVSDVVTLHVPLNDGTRNLISRERLSLMKPDAIIVNAARGGVWDEAAVAEALLEGNLGGIGSDVYAVEPMAKDHPFSALAGSDRAIFTPHMAWGAYEARVRCLDDICRSIRSFLSGGTRSRIV